VAPASRHLPPLLAVVVTLVAAGAAGAHYYYSEAYLLAMSPDGTRILCIVTEGDTEGGAGGEVMGVWSLDGGAAVRPTSGSLGMPGPTGPDRGPVLQEILPYHASDGAGAEHTQAELKRADKLRKSFRARAKTEFGITVDAGAQALPRPTADTWSTDAGTVTVTVGSDAGQPTSMSLLDRKARLVPFDGQHAACVHAIYRTDEANTFVVETFDWPLGQAGGCPESPGHQFGPPPQRSYSRVVFR
jgi:hypothetical protein